MYLSDRISVSWKNKLYKTILRHDSKQDNEAIAVFLASQKIGVGKISPKPPLLFGELS